VWATDYVTQQVADGTTLTFNNGDTFSTTNASSLVARGGGTITLQNTLSDAVSIRTSATNDFTAVYIADSSSANLGNGSEIYSDALGIRTSGTGGSFTATNLSLYIGTASAATTNALARAISASSANVNLGTNSTIYMNVNMETFNGAVRLAGGTFTATDSLSIEINGVGPTSTSYGIIATNGAQIDLGTNFSMKNYLTKGFGIHMTTTSLTLGDNAYIEAQAVALHASSASSLIASNFTIKALGVDESRSHTNGTGIYLCNDSTATISTNGNIEAKTHALYVYEATLSAANSTFSTTGTNSATVYVSAGADVSLANSYISGNDSAINASLESNFTNAAVLTISGGTVSAKNAIVKSTITEDGRPYGIETSIVFTNAVTAVSETGILYSDASGGVNQNASSIGIFIDGTGTNVEGRLLRTDNATISLTVSNNATWASAGNSDMDYLTLDNANIDYTLNSLSDHITVGTIDTTGTNTMNVTLSNETLEEINSNPLPYVIDLTKIIDAGLGVTDDIEYILADYNREGSTWEINKIAEGVYEISNINIVPEPAAAAGLLGALALLFVVRRRK